jgi:hypothetical protein
MSSKTQLEPLLICVSSAYSSKAQVAERSNAHIQASITLSCLQQQEGDFVCGHRVPWHRLTGTFLACNRRHLKSWIGNSSEGPF